MAATEIRATLEELGSGEGHDEHRPIARPIEHVIEEVEHACVGPLQILEDKH